MLFLARYGPFRINDRIHFSSEYRRSRVRSPDPTIFDQQPCETSTRGRAKQMPRQRHRAARRCNVQSFHDQPEQIELSSPVPIDRLIRFSVIPTSRAMGVCMDGSEPDRRVSPLCSCLIVHHRQPAPNASRKALTSKKSKRPSFVKSAVGSSMPKASRNAETSKKSSRPSDVRSAGQVTPC